MRIYEAQQRRSTRATEINASLMTLKECFRAVTEKVVEQETVIERRTSDGKVVLPYKPTTTENENSENDSSAVERIIVRAKKGEEKEMHAISKPPANKLFEGLFYEQQPSNSCHCCSFTTEL